MTTALEGGERSPSLPGRSLLWERPGTHCTGGWVGHRAGLERWGKSRPHRNSIPGQSSPYPVAISTELSRPACSVVIRQKSLLQDISLWNATKRKSTDCHSAANNSHKAQRPSFTSGAPLAILNTCAIFFIPLFSVQYARFSVSGLQASTFRNTYDRTELVIIQLTTLIYMQLQSKIELFVSDVFHLY